MDEKALQFDREKHVCYSPEMKAVIRERLLLHRSPEEAEALWEKFQLQYVEFLSDLPYLGGAKCTHNGVGGTYDCIAMFAYYEVLDPKPSLDEMEEMLNTVLLPPFRKIGKIGSLDHPVTLRIAGMIFPRVAGRDKKLEATCPTGYIMDVAPYDKKTGVHYKFHRCPIAEFAKAHGYTHIMPAFCNGDYPDMEAIHAGLIRQYTCANHDYCDYWIVGESSPWLKKYPTVKDENGYLRNWIDPEET